MEGAGMNITVVSYMDSVDFGIIACERSVPPAAAIALAFGAAVADLFKIALDERSGTPSVDGVGATLDPASASTAANLDVETPAPRAVAPLATVAKRSRRAPGGQAARRLPSGMARGTA
jgi:hypothetical protein